MAFSPFKKLLNGLKRTRENLAGGLQQVLGGAAVDEDSLEDLEACLLAADVGPNLSAQIVEQVRQRASRGGPDSGGLREVLRDSLLDVVGNGSKGFRVPRDERPTVVFVVGVNGGGKTTTVGKLAARAAAAGSRTLVVAADTFRAAAVDQLERWAERAGVELLKRAEGSDPSSVVFDALQKAKSESIDVVFVDTAGRLHTKTNLMAELEKLARVAGREVRGAPHEVLLVVDATTGQNGLNQAREFTRAAALTGVVLTKLDGTAKGGVALGIQQDLGVPIYFVGVGEGIDDLLEFDRRAYVAGLLGEERSA